MGPARESAWKTVNIVLSGTAEGRVRPAAVRASGARLPRGRKSKSPIIPPDGLRNPVPSSGTVRDK
jgi:hypothetical protein